jgi:hypothetical protein
VTVTETDGSPSVSAGTIKFSNGSVTDNGDGSASVSVTGGGAPIGATYIMQTADAGTSAEQALGALATGCLGSTTTTGVVASRTITGTTNEIDVTNGNCSGNPTLALASTVNLASKILRLPSSTTLPGTCSTGDVYMDTDATSGRRIYACESANTWVLQGDGSAGSIGGTTGATDNAVLRADGVGGATVQASGCTLSDTDQMTCPGGFVSGTTGAGVITILEGTVVSAGTNAGEHNLGIDSTDSRLKSRENGGSLVTYALTADKLSAFAATTSAELRGVLSDESGTGAAVFAGGACGDGE